MEPIPGYNLHGVRTVAHPGEGRGGLLEGGGLVGPLPLLHAVALDHEVPLQPPQPAGARNGCLHGQRAVLYGFHKPAEG